MTKNCFSTLQPGKEDRISQKVEEPPQNSQEVREGWSEKKALLKTMANGDPIEKQ
jgi:hypothetical protein